MSKQSIITNFYYNILYELLLIISPIITVPYIARILGAEKIGIYSYTTSIVTYFVLFASLGIGLYGKREIAYVQDDINKRSSVFYELIIIRIISSIISIIFYYLTFYNSIEFNIYFNILLIELFANMIDISWFYHGLENFKTTVIKNIIVKVITIICIFIFVKSENDLINYFLINVLSTLFGNLSLWISLHKYINKVKRNSLNVKQHIKPIIILFIPQIAVKLYSIVDRTMIGVMIESKAEVGYYEEAQKVIRILITIVTSIGTVMMPRIASIYSKGNSKIINDYVEKSFSIVNMMAFPMIFGLISISYKFVPIFFGNGYERVSLLLCVISPIIMFIGISGVTGNQYLLPTNKMKKYTFSVLFGLIVNLLLNFILISKFKSLGASIATVISEFIVMITQLLLIRNIFNIKKLVNISYKYLISSSMMFLVSICIGLIIKENIISIIFQVAISIVFYFISLLLLKENFLIELINKYVFFKKDTITIVGAKNEK